MNRANKVLERQIRIPYLGKKLLLEVGSNGRFTGTRQTRQPESGTIVLGSKHLLSLLGGKKGVGPDDVLIVGSTVKHSIGERVCVSNNRTIHACEFVVSGCDVGGSTAKREE